jgi:hypothetical protein
MTTPRDAKISIEIYSLLMCLINLLNSNKEYIIGGLSLPIIAGYVLEQYQNFSICLENYRVFNSELNEIKEDFAIEHSRFFAEHLTGAFFSTSFHETNRLFNAQERQITKKWIEFNIENKKLTPDFFFWLYSCIAFLFNIHIIKETRIKKGELSKWLTERKQEMVTELNRKVNHNSFSPSIVSMTLFEKSLSTLNSTTVFVLNLSISSS